jgi:hypothetical protein
MSVKTAGDRLRDQAATIVATVGFDWDRGETRLGLGGEEGEEQNACGVSRVSVGCRLALCWKARSRSPFMRLFITHRRSSPQKQNKTPSCSRRSHPRSIGNTTPSFQLMVLSTRLLQTAVMDYKRLFTRCLMHAGRAYTDS